MNGYYRSEDGTLVVSALTGMDGKEWYIMERPDGSISVFWTKPETVGQYVAYDSLDNATDEFTAEARSAAYARAVEVLAAAVEAAPF